MRFRARLLCLCALLAETFSIRGLLADIEKTSRILLVDPGNQQLSERLREEIESLGLEVTVVVENDSAESLEGRARAADAVGAIRITQRGPGSVEMTIVDRATGKTVSRRLAIATSTDPTSAELVATRTVELLRASLMELEAPHPPRGDAPVTRQVQALVGPAGVPRGNILAVGTGAALVKNPGLSASPDIWVAFLLRTQSGFGASARVLAPIAGGEFEGPEGTVDAFAWQYRLGALFETSDTVDGATLRFEAGAAVVALVTDGVARAPFRGVEQRSLTCGPWASAGVRFELERGLSVVVGGDATVLFPELVIRSADRAIATFGRPLLGANAGLEIAW